MEWIDEVDLDGRQSTQRRLMYTGVVVSLALHAALVLLASNFGSSPRPLPLPAVLSVDLVAAIPMPAPPAAKPAPPKPLPVKPKKVVLPKKAAPLPKKAAKPKPAPVRREKPKELEYDDAMAALRKEMGETAAVPAPAVPQAASKPSQVARAVVISPELRQWLVDTQRHVRSKYVTPPQYRGKGLVTSLSVELSAGGAVRGQPRVTASSGDPYFDDNAVRALLKASPLPVPPEAGSWPFQFRSEDP